MLYETIYKRTSSGKVQVWTAEVEGNKYRTISGQEDGKKVTSEWTIAEPKNTGRANATTGEQQAVAEVEAMYAKKLAREYRKTKDNIDEKYYTKPMLADGWKESKKRPSPGTKIVVQPKLDGMRCLTSEERGPRSRDGKLIPGAPHITDALRDSELWELEGLELDGELYNHDYREKFEELISALKKEPETDEHFKRARDAVQYHLYDIASSKKDYAVFDANGELIDGRLFDLWQIYDQYLRKYGNMFKVTVSAFIDMNEDDVGTLTELHLEDKYEGAMVRVAASKYENKRSKSLLKVKPMEDDEFEILDIEEGGGNWTGYAKVVWVRMPNGGKCKSTVKGNRAYCKDLLEKKDEAIGKKGTVTFLRYTADGMLYLPVFKGVRWDI